MTSAYKAKHLLLGLSLVTITFDYHAVSTAAESNRTTSQTFLAIGQCLKQCDEILKLAATKRTDPRAGIKEAVADITDVDSNLYLIRLLIATNKRISPYKIDDTAQRTVNWAIYECCWTIANSNAKNSAETLATIKQEWGPDGQFGLYFHRCELRQQHKPDTGWF